MSPVPPGVPRVPPGAMPLEPGRARGILAGMALFAAGMAVAGVVVLAGRAGSPGYLAAVTAGFAGLALVGVFLGRGGRNAAPLPEGPIWAPAGLAALAGAAGLPAFAVQLGLYALTGFGVVANFAVPMLRR